MHGAHHRGLALVKRKFKGAKGIPRRRGVPDIKSVGRKGDLEKTEKELL